MPGIALVYLFGTQMLGVRQYAAPVKFYPYDLSQGAVLPHLLAAPSAPSTPTLATWR